MVAFYLQKHRVEALLIIGGFEGFEAMSELLAQRERFPQFCIPVVLLPASISNNIPGTEISLGSDTALNIITQSCDQVGRACDAGGAGREGGVGGLGARKIREAHGGRRWAARPRQRTTC